MIEEYVYKNEFGQVDFKLSEIMGKKHISKNKLCKEANLHFQTLQKYYKGNITKIDIDVLIRICHALECNFSDIIVYKANKKATSDKTVTYL